MKKSNIKVQVTGLFLLGSFLFTSVVWAESLYEFYSATPVATLKLETKEMSKDLHSTFDQKTITAQQEHIQFAEYYAHLKKLIFYGSKLATYAEFERDLAFARDKEIFTGLLEQQEFSSAGNKKRMSKEFSLSKYQKMKADIEDEILTYTDMLQLSLDSCQSTMANDFYSLAANTIFRNRVHNLLQSKDFQTYMERRQRLAMRWGDLERGIEAQFNFWQKKALAADSPILDPMIVGAL